MFTVYSCLLYISVEVCNGPEIIHPMQYSHTVPAVFVVGWRWSETRPPGCVMHDNKPSILALITVLPHLDCNNIAACDIDMVLGAVVITVCMHPEGIRNQE